MLFSLWLGDTNPICRACFLSWINQGYKPLIYVDFNNLDDFFITNKDKFILEDYKKIMDIPVENIYHFTDLFRYKRLYSMGGCWVDADMYLLKRIPKDKIIISSERTQQSGAYKNQLKEIANIGVLKFPRKDPFLKFIIDKIEKSKSKSKKNQKNMFHFQDAIHKNLDFEEYKKYIAPARYYCPVNYCNVKELYYGNEFKSKYSKDITSKDDILCKSYSIHLWENLSLHKYKIDFSKVSNTSLWSTITNHLNISKNVIQIAIASYRRKNLIKETTLQLLLDNKIKYKIYIFLKDEIDHEEYKESLKDIKLDIEYVICNQEGIGKTRTFIRNYFDVGEKIIMIDDDIIDIKSKRETFNLNEFMLEAFETMKKENSKFAGCCPYDNEFYMKSGYGTGLTYTGGHLIFEIIRADPIIVDYQHFEDYIANIKYFILDKKLIRFNDIYVKTAYYNPNGGICEAYGGLAKRKEEALLLSKQIELEYPNYCSSKYSKKNKVWNLRLKTKKALK